MLLDGHGELRKPVLLLGTTIASTAVRFVLDQAEYFSSLGWRVHIVCAPTQGIDALRRCELITVHSISMSRGIAPLRDVISLIHWIKALASVRPDVVMSGTPKAGLLGMVAAWVTQVPVRIYLLRGLRAEGLLGVRRAMSLLLERIACLTATDVLSVSASLLDRYIDLGLISPGKIRVLGHGSSNGVNTHHFRPPNSQERQIARSRWGIADSDVVIGFVGRLAPDKGIGDLIHAFSTYVASPYVRLLIVGASDTLDSPFAQPRIQDRRIIYAGRTHDVRSAYWTMDAFALPSYREGLPNAVLEASATGLPIISTTATGCIDAVEPGESGLLIAPGDRTSLGVAMAQLARDAALRRQLGHGARDFVMKRFTSDDVWRKTACFLAQRTVSKRISRDS